MQTPPRFGGKVGKRSSRPTRFTILPIWVLPPAIFRNFQGRDLTGTARWDLYQGSDGQSLDGDLIELGYYKLSDNSANTSNTNLFKVLGRLSRQKPPSVTTIISTHPIMQVAPLVSFTSLPQFSSGTGNDTTDDTANTNNELNNAYEITNDTFSSLSDEITRLILETTPEEPITADLASGFTKPATGLRHLPVDLPRTIRLVMFCTTRSWRSLGNGKTLVSEVASTFNYMTLHPLPP